MFTSIRRGDVYIWRRVINDRKSLDLALKLPQGSLFIGPYYLMQNIQRAGLQLADLLQSSYANFNWLILKVEIALFHNISKSFQSVWERYNLYCATFNQVIIKPRPNFFSYSPANVHTIWFKLLHITKY